jgi:MarR family multiple antibiotic resistance transcriptional regulator
MANIYDAENFDPRMGVGHLLYRLRAELLASMDREFAADEQLAAMQGTSAQLIVLAMLSSGEVKSATDLCRGISYDAGAMTRMIDRLAKKGLVRRAPSANDRRSINVEVTEKGHLALPLMRAAAIKVQNRFLSGFAKAEVRQLEGYDDNSMGERDVDPLATPSGCNVGTGFVVG